MSEMKEFVRLTKQGGASLRDQFNKEKKPYLFVGLVCVREAYQGQGYMRTGLGGGRAAGRAGAAGDGREEQM